MSEIFFTVGLIVLQSVALLVALLIVTAFLLYADRKVWAAVQMRRGPNGVLRSLDRLRHHHRAALRRLAQPDRHREVAGDRARHADRPAMACLPQLVLVAAPADVHRLLRLGAGGNQPSALRSG